MGWNYSCESSSITPGVPTGVPFLKDQLSSSVLVHTQGVQFVLVSTSVTVVHMTGMFIHLFICCDVCLVLL